MADTTPATARALPAPGTHKGFRLARGGLAPPYMAACRANQGSLLPCGADARPVRCCARSVGGRSVVGVGLAAEARAGRGQLTKDGGVTVRARS